jgi:hypothetical protein
MAFSCGQMACNVGALTACGATLPRRASIWMMLGMGCNMMWQALAAGRNPFRTLDVCGDPFCCKWINVGSAPRRASEAMILVRWQP